MCKVAARRGFRDGFSHKRPRFGSSGDRCDRLALPHRKATCMVTLAGEAHRRLVCVAKWVDARWRVKTLTGPLANAWGNRTRVAILVRHTLRVVLMPRQGLSASPTLLMDTSGNARAGHRFSIRRFWPPRIPCGCRGCTACIYLWDALSVSFYGTRKLLTVRMFGIVARIRLR